MEPSGAPRGPRFAWEAIVVSRSRWGSRRASCLARCLPSCRASCRRGALGARAAVAASTPARARRESRCCRCTYKSDAEDQCHDLFHLAILRPKCSRFLAT